MAAAVAEAEHEEAVAEIAAERALAKSRRAL